MEALGAFMLVEDYIAKTNYKIDEVDRLIESASLYGCDYSLISILQKLKSTLNENHTSLEKLVNEIEQSNADDIFFVGHHEGNLRPKLCE